MECCFFSSHIVLDNPCLKLLIVEILRIVLRENGDLKKNRNDLKSLNLNACKHDFVESWDVFLSIDVLRKAQVQI